MFDYMAVIVSRVVSFQIRSRRVFVHVSSLSHLSQSFSISVVYLQMFS